MIFLYNMYLFYYLKNFMIVLLEYFIKKIFGFFIGNCFVYMFLMFLVILIHSLKDGNILWFSSGVGLCMIGLLELG
jgi:hypothetical protein